VTGDFLVRLFLRLRLLELGSTLSSSPSPFTLVFLTPGARSGDSVDLDRLWALPNGGELGPGLSAEKTGILR
jgi:hypothetical protein